VAPDLLRAWERRYGLLEPSRSGGGYRLYSDGDVERVHAMKTHLADGLSAREAAGLAREEPGPAVEGRGAAPSALAELREALDAFDDAAAHSVLDRALSQLTLDAVLGEIVLPYLADLGSRWERGEASVAQEHFASSLLRGRLLGLARGWDRGGGPRAILACAPGELHDLPLAVFALALRDRGWRITYLGADTPVETIEDAVRALEPALVVVSASAPDRIEDSLGALRRLAKRAPLVFAGPGTASAKLPARGLAGDPVTEAERLTRERRDGADR
jgi:DNA-binding transcriptional MerR regulator